MAALRVPAAEKDEHYLLDVVYGLLQCARYLGQSHAAAQQT